MAVRLRWDKQLADADIQVSSAGPGVVRLQGTVADGEKQQRAKELAESTQGVEQVVNDLTHKSAVVSRKGARAQEEILNSSLALLLALARDSF